MLEEFSYLGKEKAYEVVVANTQAIADQVETFDLLPKGKLFPPRLANSEEDLNRLVWDKVRELYGDDPPALIVDRLNVELGASWASTTWSTCPPRSWSSALWKTAIWWAPGAPWARPWRPICPASRR